MGRIGYYSGVHTKNNVLAFLERQVRERPEKTAFIYPQGHKEEQLRITYGTFFERASALAQTLHTLGVGKGDAVTVYIPLRPELYYAIAAIEWLGAVPVFLDSWTRESDIVHAFHATRPKVFIADSATLERYVVMYSALGVVHTIAYDADTFAVGVSNTAPPLVAVAQDDTALVTYTTGSTGAPKAANRTHRFLAAQHYKLTELFPYRDTDVDMPVFPVFALNSLAAGVTVALPNMQSTHPEERMRELLAQMDACQVTCLTLSPALFSALAFHGAAMGAELPFLRRVLTGGAPISENEVDRFLVAFPMVEVEILYGSTEVEPIAHINARTMCAYMQGLKSDVGVASDQGVVVGPIVQELRHALIATGTSQCEGPVDTIDALTIPEGAIGELVVAGEHVCGGYYGDEQAFFRTKICDKEGTVWHRTGDLCRIDQKGYLWVVGRSHNIIRDDKGHVFFPVRVEILLREIRGVLCAAYLNRHGEGDGPITVVISFHESVVPQEQKHIITLVYVCLSEARVPVDEVVYLSAIPMDIRHHSKVDYTALRDLLRDHAPTE